MSTPISVGDLLDFIVMVNNIRIALNDARGSAADCRRTVEDIDRFNTELACAERIAIPLAERCGDSNLVSSIRERIETSKRTTAAYELAIEPYKRAFGKEGKRMSALKRSYWTMGWFFHKRADAAEARERLQAERISLLTSLSLLDT